MIGIDNRIFKKKIKMYENENPVQKNLGPLNP